MDGDETDVDCGGGCSPCARGLMCNDNSDCVTNYCGGTVCLPFNCALENVANEQSGFTVDGGEGEALGSQVAVVGDYNGDGREEFAVSTFTGGNVYIVHGKDDHTPVSTMDLFEGMGGYVITGINVANHVADIDDLNADGRDELIISASSPMEAAYVVFGQADTGQIDVSELGDQGYVIQGNVGSPPQIASLDDINDDGLDEVVLGDQGGLIYVVYGKADSNPVDLGNVANGIGGFAISGDETFGSLVADGGDIDGDSLADILVATGGGTSYAVLSPGFAMPSPIIVDDLIAAENVIEFATGANEVSAIDGEKDFNGDNVPDTVLGFSTALSGQGLVGAVFMDPVVPVVDVQEDFVTAGMLVQSPEFQAIGTSLRAISDIDDDGFDEFMIGGPGSGGVIGDVYVVYGRPDNTLLFADQLATSAAGFVISGHTVDALEGFSVDAGNIDGGDSADFIIGAPSYMIDEGRVYVVRGELCMTE